MGDIPTICSLCGRVAKHAHTCTLCGTIVCSKCYDAGLGLCRTCATRTKPVK